MGKKLRFSPTRIRKTESFPKHKLIHLWGALEKRVSANYSPWRLEGINFPPFQFLVSRRRCPRTVHSPQILRNGSWENWQNLAKGQNPDQHHVYQISTCDAWLRKIKFHVVHPCADSDSCGFHFGGHPLAVEPFKPRTANAFLLALLCVLRTIMLGPKTQPERNAGRTPLAARVLPATASSWGQGGCLCLSSFGLLCEWH